MDDAQGLPDIRIDMRGRTAIVTGASRGIGRAIAEALAGAGAAVTLTARRQEGLLPVAEAITEAGGRALAVAAHAGEPEALAAMVARTVETYGGVDVLVNNAGTCPHYGPLLSADDGLWDKTFDVNLRGPFHLSQLCAPHLTEGGGAIVNVASIAGLLPQPGVGLYCLSKAALVMMTRVLGAELAGAGVRVNAVAPGFVKTRFSKAIWSDEAQRERTLRDIPQGRLAEPEEIAQAVLFLASDLARFASGSTLVVDGGQLVAPGLDLA